jgi:hypothetical protein
MAGCGGLWSWLLRPGPDLPPIPGRLCLVVLLLVLLSYPPPSWTTSIPVTSSSATKPSRAKFSYDIGAVFEVENVSAYTLAFKSAVKTVNVADTAGIVVREVTMPTLNSVGKNFHYICNAISNHNITIFIAVGSQNMINMLSIITKYLGIPILGYNTDRNHVVVRGERPLYLQFDPSKSLIARALEKTMVSNHWYYASILIEDNYATDGFLQTFKRLTQHDP